MTQAAVSEIKASLSEYLAKVKRGNEIVITDRGHPIAVIVPFHRGSGSVSDREKLARDGILEMGKTGKAPSKFLKPSSVKDPRGLALKALLEEREEDR